MPVATDDRAVVAQLQVAIAALTARVAALEAAQRTASAFATSSSPDDVRLLAFIWRAIGDRPFRASQLRRYARLHRDSELGAALRGCDAIGIGLRLRRLCGRDYGAFRLQSIKRTNQGHYWHVQVVTAPAPTI